MPNCITEIMSKSCNTEYNYILIYLYLYCRSKVQWSVHFLSNQKNIFIISDIYLFDGFITFWMHLKILFINVL